MLVQLSGVPGTGKSALARAVVAATTCVALDTDVLKSSLIDAGVPLATSGPATYRAALALARDLLAQGRNVVLDSPCRYQELLDAGRTIASEAGVRYGFVELWARDWAVVLARLDGRAPRDSQVASATAPAPGTDWELGTAEATLLGWQEQLVHPESDWLRLAAESSTEDNLALTLRYLGLERGRS